MATTAATSQHKQITKKNSIHTKNGIAKIIV
jgi:hypothetical protein